MKTEIHSNRAAGISPEQLSMWSSMCGENIEIIHNGRNQIRLLKLPDVAITIKRFSSKFKNRVLYAMRKSKARKSYENALTLLNRGIGTPQPYGYIEKRGLFNMLYDSEYVCVYERMSALHEAIQSYGRECLEAFAGFVAALHRNGIRHDDLNNTNVRVAVDENNRFIFSLIDLNRMKIYETGQIVPEKECFKNICRFSSFDSDYIYFATKYLEARNMDSTFLSSAIKTKKQHDRKVDAKKWFRKLISFQYI